MGKGNVMAKLKGRSKPWQTLLSAMVAAVMAVGLSFPPAALAELDKGEVVGSGGIQPVIKSQEYSYKSQNGTYDAENGTSYFAELPPTTATISVQGITPEFVGMGPDGGTQTVTDKDGNVMGTVHFFSKATKTLTVKDADGNDIRVGNYNNQTGNFLTTHVWYEGKLPAATWDEATQASTPGELTFSYQMKYPGAVQLADGTRADLLVNRKTTLGSPHAKEVEGVWLLVFDSTYMNGAMDARGVNNNAFYVNRTLNDGVDAGEVTAAKMADEEKSIDDYSTSRSGSYIGNTTTMDFKVEQNGKAVQRSMSLAITDLDVAGVNLSWDPNDPGTGTFGGTTSKKTTWITKWYNPTTDEWIEASKAPAGTTKAIRYRYNANYTGTRAFPADSDLGGQTTVPDTDNPIPPASATAMTDKGDATFAYQTREKNGTKWSAWADEEPPADALADGTPTPPLTMTRNTQYLSADKLKWVESIKLENGVISPVYVPTDHLLYKGGFDDLWMASQTNTNTVPTHQLEDGTDMGDGTSTGVVDNGFWERKSGFSAALNTADATFTWSAFNAGTGYTFGALDHWIRATTSGLYPNGGEIITQASDYQTNDKYKGDGSILASTGNLIDVSTADARTDGGDATNQTLVSVADGRSQSYLIKPAEGYMVAKDANGRPLIRVQHQGSGWDDNAWAVDENGEYLMDEETHEHLLGAYVETGWTHKVGTGSGFLAADKTVTTGSNQYEYKDNGDGTYTFTFINNQKNGHIDAVFVPKPELEIEKAATPENVKVGDTVDYEIKVTNKGAADLFNTTVTDVLPEGLEYEPTEGDGVSSYDAETRTITWENQTVRANTTLTKANTNRLEVARAAQTETSQTAEKLLGPKPENSPETERYLSDDYKWTNAVKAAAEQGGEPTTLKVKVKVNSAAEPEATNTVKAEDPEMGNEEPPTDTATVKLTPDVDVVKHVIRINGEAYGGNNKVVMPGDIITYEIVAYNYGNGPAKNSVITDVLDEGFTLQSASPNYTYDAESKTITWNLADEGNQAIPAATLKEGKTASTTLVKEDMNPGVLKYEVSVTVDADSDSDGEVGNTVTIRDKDDLTPPEESETKGESTTETPVMTAVQVKKVWDDADNQDGLRTNIQLQLNADGAKVEADANGKDLNPANATDAAQDVDVTWKYLPAYQYDIEPIETTVGDTVYTTQKITKGADITYSVSEVSVPEGYEMTPAIEGSYPDGFVITATNKHVPDTATLSVAKVWDDDNNRDGLRADATFNLYKLVKLDPNSEELTETKAAEPITISKDAAGDAAKATWDGLPVFANGEKIQYVVKESSIEGYTCTITDSDTVTLDKSEPKTLTATNSYTPEVTEVKVTKSWDDDNNAYETRPESVTVTLVKNGETTDKQQTLSEENNWTATWTELNVNEPVGSKNTYTVAELGEVDGYETGTVTGDAENGFTVTNTLKRPDIVVEKSTDATEAKPGDEITYTVTVKNEGQGVAKNTTVTDTLGAGLEFVSASNDGAEKDGVITWNNQTVEAGASKTYTVVAKVTDAARENVTNSADANDPADPENPPTAKTNTPLKPALAIEKTVKAVDGTTITSQDADKAKVGSTITYQVKVTNAGYADTTDTTVTDTLGAGLKLVTAVPDATEEGGTLTWTGVKIDAQSSVTYTVIAEVTEDAGAAVTNTAKAEDPGTPDKPESSTSTPLTPDLEIEKSGPETANVGDEITYTITVSNVGKVAAEDTTVTDTLPAGLEFVSATDDIQPAEGKLTWEKQTIAAGESKTYTVTAKVLKSAIPAVTNTAKAEDPNDPNETPTDETTTKVTAPDLEIEKTADTQGPVKFGDTITYTVKVTNAGAGNATDTTATDMLGAGLEFVSASNDGTNDNGTITWTGLNIKAGESVELTVTAKVVAKSDDEVANNAMAEDPNDPNNPPTDDVTTPVKNPKVAIEKTANVKTAKVGDTITYTVTAQNTGEGDTTTATVTDTLGAGLEVVSASDEGANENGTITWNNVALKAGASKTFTVTAKVLDNAPAAVANNAAIDDPTDPSDPNDPSKTSTVTTPLTETKTVTRTIEYKYIDENGQEASATVTQTVTFERTGSIDPETGEATYPDWADVPAQSYDVVDSPNIPGWTPDQLTVPGDEVKATDDDSTVTVVYTPAPPVGTDRETYGAKGTTQTITPEFNISTGTTPNGETNKIESVKLVDPVTGEPADKVEVAEGTYTVNPDGTVSFTPKDPNYVGDPTPVDMIATDSNGQTATATYTPHVRDNVETKEVTRTVEYKYIDENGQEASKTVTQTVQFVRTGTVDDKGNVTYPDWDTIEPKTVPSVDSPAIPGWNPDQDIVRDLQITLDKDGNPTDPSKLHETVIYTPEDPTGTPDETYAGKNTPQTGTPTFEVTTPTTPDGEPNKIEKVELIDPATGEPSDTVKVDGGTYAQNPDGTITFTPDADYVGTPEPATVRGTDSNGKTVTTTYQPHVVDNSATKDVTRTITYTYLTEDGTEASQTVEQTVTFNTVCAVDPKTGEVSEPNWADVPAQEFPAVDTPVIDGWTPTATSVDKKTVSPTDEDTVERIVYTPEAPKGTPDKSFGGKNKPQTGTPTFEVTTPTTPDGTPNKIDSYTLLDKDGNPSTTVIVPEGTYTIDPTTGEITFTPNKDFVGTPTPATVQGTDSNGKTATTTYQPNVVDDVETKTVTRTIEYKYLTEDGKEASATVTQTVTFERTATVDPKTGTTTFPEWDTVEPKQVDAVASPAIDGWTPDQAEVPALEIKATDKDSSVTVVYTPEAPTATPAESFGDKGKPQSGTPSFAVTTGTTPEGTPNKIEKIELLDAEGNPTDKVEVEEGTYTIDDNGTVTFTPKDPNFVGDPTPVNVQGTDSNGKTAKTTYTPHIKEGVETKTVKRDITYTYIDENGQEASATVTQEVTFERTATTDPKTGELVYPDWSTVEPKEFPAATSPAIDGWTPDKATVDAAPVKATDEDSIEHVVYTPADPKGTPDETYAGKNTPQTGKPAFSVTTPTTPNGEQNKIESYTLLDTKGNPSTTVVVPEGMYQIDTETGEITFTPNKDFVGDPTPVTVRGTDSNGKTATTTYTPHVVDNSATKDVTRTITYTYLTEEGTEASKTVTQTVTFNTVCAVDPETGTVSDPNWADVPAQEFPTVETPVIDGWTPNKTLVDKAEVKATDSDSEVHVVYTPEAPNGTDKTTYGAKNTPQSGTPTFDVTTGTTPDGTPNKIESYTLLDKDGNPVDILTVDGGTYTIDKDTGEVTFTPDADYVGTPEPATVQATDSNGKTATATYQPSVKEGVQTKTVKREITYTYVKEDGTTASTTVTQEVTFERTATTDPKTGELVYPDWSTVEPKEFPEATSPSIYGWTADKTSVAKAVVKATDSDSVEHVVYQAKDPEGTDKTTYAGKNTPQSGTPTFKVNTPNTPDGSENKIESYTLVDKDGNPVDTLTVYGGTYTINSSTGEVTFTPDKDFVGTPEPATVQATDSNGKTAKGTYQPNVVDNEEQVTKTRTITYVYEKDGSEASKPVTQTATFTRTATVNPETGELTWGDWSVETVTDTDSPEIEGYDFDKETVDGGRFINPDEFPNDEQVTYKQIPVDPEPEYNTETKTVTRTIEYKYIDENGEEASKTVTQTVTFERTGEKQADGTFNYPDWSQIPAQHFPAVDSPEIDGWTADETKIAQATVAADDESMTELVIYTAVPKPEPEPEPQPEPNPSLTIEKTASTVSAKPGFDIMYTIKVTNTGDVALSNTAVADLMPANLKYVKSEGPDGSAGKTSVAESGTTIEWTGQSFAIGETKVYKVYTQLVSLTDPVAINTAKALDTDFPEKTTVQDDAEVTVTETKTVTRTIEYKYIDKDGKEASGTVTQTIEFERTGEKQADGSYKFPEWDTVPAQSFPEVKTPGIDGWTSDKATVPAKEIKATEEPANELVVYTPQAPKGSPKVTVDAKGKTQTATPVFEVTTPTTPDGKPNQIESYKLLDKDGKAVDKVTVPGEGTYTIDPVNGTVTFVPEDGFVGKAKGVTVQATDSNGQKATATYTPEVKENVETKTVKRTITYKYKTADGREAAKTVTQEVQFVREGTYNAETGKVEYPDWSTVKAQEFPALKAPTVDGWTPDNVETPAKEVKATDDDSTAMVIYQANPPIATDVTSNGFKGEPQSGTPEFEVGTKVTETKEYNQVVHLELIDIFTNQPAEDGKVTVEGQGEYTIDPENPGTVVFTPEDDFVGDPTPVTVRGTDKNGESADATYQPHVVEKEQTVTKSRTITYIYEKDGKQASEPVVQTVTFKRSAIGIDESGNPIWGDWEAVTVNDAASPAIEGYDADKNSVAGGTFGSPDAFPGDEVVKYEQTDPGKTTDDPSKDDDPNKDDDPSNGGDKPGDDPSKDDPSKGDPSKNDDPSKSDDQPGSDDNGNSDPGKDDQPGTSENPKQEDPQSTDPQSGATQPGTTTQVQTTSQLPSVSQQSGVVSSSRLPMASSGSVPTSSVTSSATLAAGTGTSTAKTADGLPVGIPVALVGAAAAAALIARRKLA